MAVSRTPTQITWSAANTLAVTTGSPKQESDAVAINATAIDGRVIVKASQGGTPVGGDDLEIKVLLSLGDPDADPDTTDEFETDEEVVALGTLQLDVVDPNLRSFAIPINAKSFKLHVENKGASTITVAAEYSEKRAY